MEGFSLHNSSLMGRKNQATFEHDCISRNGPRIKITQPNSIILVSFSSAEDALYNASLFSRSDGNARESIKTHFEIIAFKDSDVKLSSFSILRLNETYTI